MGVHATSELIIVVKRPKCLDWPGMDKVPGPGAGDEWVSPW